MKRAIVVLGLLLSSSCTILFGDSPNISVVDAGTSTAIDAGTSTAIDAGLDSGVDIPVALCTSWAPLQTNFNTVSSLWKTELSEESSITYDIDGALLAPAGDTRYAALESKFAHDSREQALTIEMGAIPQDLEVSFSLYSESHTGEENEIKLSHLNGSFEIQVNGFYLGSPIPSEEITYWQISHETNLIGGLEIETIIFRTGNDIDALSTLMEVSSFNGYDPSHAKARITVSNIRFSPKQLQLKNVFTDATPVAYCPIDTFIDAFDGTTIAPQWNLQKNLLNDLFDYQVENGKLSISARTTNGGTYSLESNRGFSLKESAITMHLPPTLEVETTLLLYRDDNNSIKIIGYPDGTASAEIMVAGASQNSGRIPIQENLLRIREVSGSLLVQTGNTATGVLLSLSTPFDVNGFSPKITGTSLQKDDTVIVLGINVE